MQFAYFYFLRDLIRNTWAVTIEEKECGDEKKVPSGSQIGNNQQTKEQEYMNCRYPAFYHDVYKENHVNFIYSFLYSSCILT